MKAPTWREEQVNKTLKRAMAYGNDHAVGKFIMIWELADPDKPTGWLANQPDDDNLIISRDEFLGSLTENDMIRLAGANGFKLTKKDLQ